MKNSMLYIVMLFISPSVWAHSGHYIAQKLHTHLFTTEVEHSFLSNSHLLILSLLLIIVISGSVYAYVKK